jgi:hypothetical protein
MVELHKRYFYSQCELILQENNKNIQKSTTINHSAQYILHD